ncbi:hypothetical protein, partial [Actinoallomurus acaciae]
LVDRGRALAAEAEHAEPVVLAALADPAFGRRPFEHALTLLEYAERLRRRRRRRIGEARPFLTTTQETFLRLGARPWTERASSGVAPANLHGRYT